MTQLPPQPEPFVPPTLPYATGIEPKLPTSGLSVASLACGVVGLASCCLVVPSLLGIVFGGVALPAIKRGEVRGKGLAAAGIVTGIIGLLMGAALWILLAISPDTVPIKGAAVSDVDRAMLRSIGALTDDENLELLCATGLLTVEESGIVLTDRRLVIYDDTGYLESCDLVDVVAIEFIAGANWLDEGQFTVETQNGDELFFWISSDQGGDKIFDRSLRRQATKARRAAGRPAPKSALTPISDSGKDE